MYCSSGSYSDYNQPCYPPLYHLNIISKSAGFLQAYSSVCRACTRCTQLLLIIRRRIIPGIVCLLRLTPAESITGKIRRHEAV